MTFFGAFLRSLGGWIAVADLIALMGELGLDEQAVRSSVSRLKRRGVIASERRSAAGYVLTEHGSAILRAGDARIFGRRTPRAGWLLVVFSIPEAQRALRHRLRAGLAGLGLGTVAAGVWIAPAGAEEEVRRLVAELGVGDRVELFVGAPAGDPSRWWDLERIAAEYRAYLARWEHAADGDAFSSYVRQLDDWRRIPFHDPGLPAAVLPPDWPGEHAWTVFRSLEARWHEAALAHAHMLCAR